MNPISAEATAEAGNIAVPDPAPAAVEQAADHPATEAPTTGPLAPFVSNSATHVRSLCLRILTVLALVFALQWGQKFLVPLVFGIFIAYTLNPLVACLERI